MTGKRRLRSLSAEERALWAEVLRGVAPLARRFPASLPDADAAPSRDSDQAGPTPEPPAAQPAVPWSASKTVRPSQPPLAPFERKVRLALRRGTRGVDARLDLHGLRQDQAHAALLAFLRRSQNAGHGLVLVVTGKGAGGSDGPTGERGVLRRMVPNWLRLPDLRPLVLGFEEGPPRLGGSGALYIRLRRHRADGDR